MMARLPESRRMAVGDATGEMLRLRAEVGNPYRAELTFQILPLSLLILALVLTTGMAFFHSDFWLLGASFIAAGFLVVSTLFYLASKRTRAHSNKVRKGADVKHLGTGTLSTAAGAFALLVVTGDVGASLGGYETVVAQLGFALTVAGSFWLVMTVRDMI